MNEDKVFFRGDQPLEGKFGWPAPPKARGLAEPVWEIKGGVVVAHPYPPNGAHMDLPVIHRIASACRDKGFASLRFNFRGVGGSQGSFSGKEEHRDVMAAVSFMSAQLDRPQDSREAGPPLGLAGWSFGSVMAARAVAELPEIQALALVGFVPKWEHLPEDTLERLGFYRGPVLAVCAGDDDMGAPKDVAKVLTDLDMDFRIKVVRGADHYLQGKHREVGGLVAGFFDEVLGH